MDHKPLQKTIITRGLLTVIFVAGGFVFPFLFLLAAFFAWTIYSDLTEPRPTAPPGDAWYTRRWTVTAEDPEWKTYFLRFCESPAEEAFLEAMINAYKLLPNDGILLGSGVDLNLQVEHKPYRVDFLVNKWLVVEIDGAAWHSSPDAVERDRIRDEFFVANEFAVVRIPAKIVFTAPGKAIEMVRAAVAGGAPSKKVVTTPPRASVAQSLLQAVKLVDKFVSEVEAGITKASEIQSSIGLSRQTFAVEKMVIDSAIAAARNVVDLEEKLAADPNLRKNFDAVYARLEKAQSLRAERGPKEAPAITISSISRPATHPDPDINKAIVVSYSTLINDRSRYFDDVRKQILSDPRISAYVQSNLERQGRHAVWAQIMKPDPAAVAYE
ncbi:endonuclease domain-containing protein [Rhizobium leguminosarum]|uniref:endonuclease domain-containing protein n=1 Tax=Rhizobium leguminosarum TaxID=384 RepID=UPI003F9C062B